MKRRHLFELEDQAWFPTTLRDLSTDYLHFIQTAMKLHEPIAPLIAEALRASECTHIVDLCSGSAGPLPALLQDLDRRGIRATATLTDLFPNLPAFARAADDGNGRITFERQPVDARAVPRHLAGLRTMFNGFHHFRPGDATAILRDAVLSRQPIAIFEVSDRSFAVLLSILLMPIFVWLATPFIRPFRWTRLLYTYPVPLVPLTCLWDGLVSQMRAYTAAELAALGAAAGAMEWRSGHVPFPRGPGRFTYLVGCPMRSSRN
jgi:hypothetical protein